MPKRPDNLETVLLALELLRRIPRRGQISATELHEQIEAAGLKKRDDFYWTLHSVFVNRRDQREIFDQAFHVYWRNPRLLEKMMEMLLPSVSVPADPDDKKQLSRRLVEGVNLEHQRCGRIGHHIQGSAVCHAQARCQPVHHSPLS